MFDTKRPLRAALLASACTGSLAAAAVAQDQTEGDIGVTTTDEDAYVDEIVVTGIRRSIEDSLDIKKANSSIVEAISAEDIGRLPDVSIADALARLPGVTAQRVRGRSQGISIRGLGPNLSVGLLNGREQVSANGNRGIEFDQYPSELLGSVLVYKTPDASLAAFGIAGAVDNRTRRPLEFGERKINLSGRYVFNDRDQLNPDFPTDGYRLFASYIDQNEAGTLGWSIGGTIQSNPTQFVSRELKTGQGQVDRVGFDADGNLFGRDRDFDDTDPRSAEEQFADRLVGESRLAPEDNPRFGNVSRDFKRTSIAGSLQFEPTERFRTIVDAYYTDTEDEGIFRGVETPIASWSGADLEAVDFGDGPFVDAARYSEVVPILRTDTEGNNAEIFSIGGNVAYDLNDRLTVMADLAYSTLERNDLDYESYAGTGPARSGAQDTIGFGFTDDGDFAVETLIDYTDPSNVLLTDPGGWGQVGFLREPEINDELTQLRLEADYEVDLGPIASVTVGYYRTEREKDFDNNGTFLRAGDRFEEVEGGLAAPIPDVRTEGVTDPADLGLSILAYDPSRFLVEGQYRLDPATDDTEWVVEEDINTFYAKAEIEATLGAIPVSGNIGIQYVDTNQASTGTLNGLGAVIGTQTVEDSYGDWLPNLNLNFEVVEDTLLRFAAYKAITRARFDSLAANQSIGFNELSCVDTDEDQVPDDLIAFDPPAVVCFNLGGGNPTLRPYESVGYDVSFERYFSPTSAFILAAFRKDLSDWVFGRATFVDGTQQIDAFGAGDLLDENPELSLTALGGPVNIAEGHIQGIEVTGRLGLGDITPALDGFGINGSYTYLDNELTLPIDDVEVDIPIPGYSEEIWSAEAYFERDGFRARVNARYSSELLAELQQFDGGLIFAQQQPETIVDAQLGYVFDGGPLDGFSIIGEVFNLTNQASSTIEPLRDADRNVIGSFPNRYEEYGRTYNITLAKEF